MANSWIRTLPGIRNAEEFFFSAFENVIEATYTRDPRQPELMPDLLVMKPKCEETRGKSCPFKGLVINQRNHPMFLSQLSKVYLKTRFYLSTYYPNGLSHWATRYERSVAPGTSQKHAFNEAPSGSACRGQAR